MSRWRHEFASTFHEFYAMTGRTVPPSFVPLTEDDARETTREMLLPLCQKLGPTRVGKALGCDEKTVRNARDETSTLRIDLLVNALGLDPLALDGFLLRAGRRSVPAECIGAADGDALCNLLKVSHLLSMALSDQRTPGALDDAELMEIPSDALDICARAIAAMQTRQSALRTGSN
ncbi:hypothetical protein [Sphingomonas sp. CFBP 13720]|uniref:hypothetical protein n=1 Tax=Sphingomonas sp. CFBP 13720 TaxID=2775302 RepID=UPI001784C45C|nr:hypothetical protein [Sphingomonas sp. CFBP 13720]MBD8677947.1 hypothetical protein [Sphingomonas sp. CFBP 13720]